MRHATTSNAALLAILLGIATITIAGDGVESKPKTAKRVVKAFDIATGKVEILGRLGAPMGTILTVTAEMVEDNPNTKADDPTLRVSSINDTPLDKPISVQFRRWSQQDEALTPGTHHRLRVYETGGFSGVHNPSLVERKRSVPASTGWGFKYEAVIVRVLPEPELHKNKP